MKQIAVKRVMRIHMRIHAKKNPFDCGNKYA